MKSRIILTIGFLCLGTQVQAATTCSLATAEFCRDTNQLVWSHGFADAIKRFVGKQKGEIAHLDSNILSALGGPPDPPVSMLGYHSGGWLFSACVAHECSIKGALLLDWDHKIRGVAVFDFSRPETMNPRLDLVLKDTRDDAAQKLLVAWARWTIARDLFIYTGIGSTTDLTGVRILPASQ